MLRRRLVSRRSSGRYLQRFPDHIPPLLVHLADQLDSILDDDAPELQRLFPTAYAHDPEKDAGYQILARDQLIDGRREAIDTLRRTVDQDELTEDELSAWMAVTNDLRLVIGTRLDVSEDDDDAHWAEVDEPLDAAAAVDRELRQIYDVLGMVLSEIIDGLSDGLTG